VPLKLDIDILQKHRVCRDGQVQFRRKFNRSKTWPTLEAFTKDFATYHTVWNWDEAADKFLGSQDEWEQLKEKLQEDWAEESENDHDTEYSDDQAGCVAWCRLYWAKMNPSTGEVHTLVPGIAREYLDAVAQLEQARRFKALIPARPRVSVDFDGYHKGADEPVRKFIASQLEKSVPQWTDDAIAHYSAQADTLREKLHETMNAEAAARAQPAAPAAITEKDDDESEAETGGRKTRAA